MPTNQSNFPKAIDIINSVLNGKTVYSADINTLALAATAIQQSAKNIIMTDKPVEVSGTTTRRRKILFDQFYFDSGAAKDYFDVQVPIKDEAGSVIPGAWASTDYAIALEIVNCTSGPAYPAKLNTGADLSTAAPEPYPYSIIGYSTDQSTATVRLFNNSLTEMEPPHLVKTDPNDTYVYALCGTSIDDLYIHKWNASSKVYSGGFKLVGHPTLPSTDKPWDVILDMAIGPDCIYVLYRHLGVKERGKVARYSMTGAMVSSDWFAATQMSAPAGTYNGSVLIDTLDMLNAIATDPSGNLYVAGWYDGDNGTNAVTGYNEMPLDAKGGQIVKFDGQGRAVKLAGKTYVATAGEDKNLLSSNYSHVYGDNFQWSWCYGLAYNPNDGYLYASWLSSHKTSGGGANGHNFVVRYGTNLNRAISTYAPSNTTSANKNGGRLAAITLNSKVYVTLLHLWDDASATTTIVHPGNLEQIAGGANQQIYRWEYVSGTTSKITWMTGRTTDVNGAAFSPVTNRITSVTATKDGKVYFCSSGVKDRIQCIDPITGVAGASLTIPGSAIKASIRTTVVTAADPANDLKVPSTGNFAPNADFTRGATHWMHGLINAADSSRNASLLRDKPESAINGSSVSGWGFLHVDGREVWHQDDAPAALANAVTDPYSAPDSSSGVTKVTTGAAAVTGPITGLGSRQLSFIADPTNNALYIPTLWLGNAYDTDTWPADADVHDVIDYATGGEWSIDTVPVYRSPSGSTEIRGEWGVPVCEADLPRAYAAGDKVQFMFQHRLHLLDTIQSLDYDNRRLSAYTFMQFLDGSNQPIAPVNLEHYTDGKPVYRIDWYIPGGPDTTVTAGISYTSSILKSLSHTYQITPWKWFDSGLVTVPAGTQRIRIGFVCLAWSRNRNDNILSDPGETGGAFIDNISLVITNS